MYLDDITEQQLIDTAKWEIKSQLLFTVNGVAYTGHQVMINGILHLRPRQTILLFAYKDCENVKLIVTEDNPDILRPEPKLRIRYADHELNN